MNSFNTKHKSGALLLVSVMMASLTGCYDHTYVPAPQPQQQFTQQCGQSVSTGAMECIAVPVGQANPYAYPAPMAYYSAHGYGYGTVLSAAALGALGGYMIGGQRHYGTPYGYSSSYSRHTTVVQNHYYPNQTSPASRPGNVSQPSATKPAFTPTAAAATQTAKPTSIPASAPARSFSPTPASAPTPSRSFSPSPSRTFSPSPSRTFSPSPSRTFSPSPSRSFSSSRRR